MQRHIEIEERLAALPGITLEEMKGVKLMNRTDTKFVTCTDTLVKLLGLLGADYFCQQIDGRCTARYKTLYWDDPDSHCAYTVHELGRLPRRKIRVRSYVDAGLHFLEVKRKNNHGRTRKVRTAVSSPEAVAAGGDGAAFLAEEAGGALEGLRPVVGNSFRRITLVNRCHTERLTIDFDLRFHNLETRCEASLRQVCVIELKRDGRQPSPVLPLLRRLHVKPMGFSKYVIGSALTNPALRRNRIKPRLHAVEKLEGRPILGQAH